MNTRLFWASTISVVAIAASFTGSSATPPAKAKPVTYAHDVKPFATKYCLKCHTSKPGDGKFGFNNFPDAKSVKTDAKNWGKAAQYLDTMKMPPKGLPQPTPAERKATSTWIKACLAGKVSA